jgi:dCTP deaminase
MMLASTVEKFCMPDDLVGIVHDKSTWARQGLAVQNTVIEPGWRGFLTLELTWICPEAWEGGYGNPLRIQAGTAIAQVIFHQLTAPTEQGYEGKYQDQEQGAQAARFDKDPHVCQLCGSPHHISEACSI